MLLELYISFFKVGLFSIGGGLVALPLIQFQVVDLHSWLSIAEFSDVISIAQMTPGPIALNAATFVGTKMQGITGAIVATFATITPSTIIVAILAYIYFKYKNLGIIRGVLEGLRPAAIGLIASAGMTIFILAIWGEKGIHAILDINSFNYIAFILFCISLFILRKFKKNPILIMLACGVVGVIISLFS